MSYHRSTSGLGLSYDAVLILEQRLRQGYAGLGDYASDHAAWLREKAAYDQAYAAWNATQQQLGQAYQQALAAYVAATAKYKADVQKYNLDLNVYQVNESHRLSRQHQAMVDAKKQYPDLVFPADFPGCVSKAEHDSYVSSCSFKSTIKGLGAAPASGNPCGLALLSVCVPPFTKPVWPGNAPVPPGKPIIPAQPEPPRAEPQAPPPQAPPQTSPPSVTSAPPSTTKIPTSSGGPTLTPASSSTSGGLLSNGLLLVVLAGGGYALYRTLKKPKAA